MADLFYRKLTGLPGGESPVVMVTTVAGEQGFRTVDVGGVPLLPLSRAAWWEAFREGELVSPSKINVLY